MDNKMRLPLSGSQARALKAGIAGLLALMAMVYTLYTQLSQLPGIHLPGWASTVALVVLTILNAAGITIPMVSRSLDTSNSGNGAGLITTNHVSAGDTPAVGGVASDVSSLLPLLFPHLSELDKQVLQTTAVKLLSTAQEAKTLNMTQSVAAASMTPVPPSLQAIFSSPTYSPTYNDADSGAVPANITPDSNPNSSPNSNPVDTAGVEGD